MNEREETKEEILNRGLADELTAAAEYINCAAMYGDTALKQQFLQYADDELHHALKIMRLMQDNEITPQNFTIPVPSGGLAERMVEYIANEEAAIFYYDILQKLYPTNDISQLCREIKQEEEVHLRNIKELFKQAKEYM